jgi:hypothetical protein
VQVTPALAYQVSWLSRQVRRGAPEVEARAVFPAEWLEVSSIPLNARVLSVNGRVVSSRTQVDRELRRGGSPLRVLVRDGDHQFFGAIGPAR